uniref:Uncharacterized protein n=1 Tax=Ditylenchus dipsaci TaxID=166011 RepID=A0A915DXR9_9BILA
MTAKLKAGGKPRLPDNLIDKVKNLYEEFSPDKWSTMSTVGCDFRRSRKLTAISKRAMPGGRGKKASHLLSRTDPLQLYLEPGRFPKCWSKLGPLLCGSIFRPCNLKTVFKHAWASWNSQRAETMASIFEMQRPSAIQLIPTVPEGTQKAELKLFNPRCKVAYLQSPSQPKTYQCLWPLVHLGSDKTMSAQSKPIIDACYMPCRSPLLTIQTTFDYFYYFAALLCVMSLSIYIYLAGISSIH